MTFDPFGDFDARGYLRNTKGLNDPEAVKLFEHTAFRLNVEEALAVLRATARPLGYQDVLDTHRRLFGDVYPWAGQDREAIASQLAVGKGGYESGWLDGRWVRVPTTQTMHDGSVLSTWSGSTAASSCSAAPAAVPPREVVGTAPRVAAPRRPGPAAACPGSPARAAIWTTKYRFDGRRFEPNRRRHRTG